MMTRYDSECDNMVPVSQDWCDTIQERVGLLAMQREIIRAVSGMDALTHAGDIKVIWGCIREIGLAATIAESQEERKRQREISEKISAGLNAELGFGQ